MDLSDFNLTGVNLEGANLTNTKLPKNLVNVSLTGCNLSGKDFSDFNLTKVNLEGIEYDAETKFPPLEKLESGMLLNLLKLTVDVAQSNKAQG